MKKRIYLWSSLIILVLAAVAFLWFKFGGGIGADENLNALVLPSGWTMVNGTELSKVDENALVASNVAIYSYNDPDHAGNKWTIHGTGCTANDSLECVNDINFDRKLSYFIYNRSAFQVSILKRATSDAVDKPLGQGWHVIAWKGQNTIGSGLKNDLTVTFGTSGAKSLDEALTSQRVHSKIVSIKISAPRTFANQTINYETNDSLDTVISMGGAFWIYNKSTEDISGIACAGEPPVANSGTYKYGMNVDPTMFTRKPDMLNDMRKLNMSFVRLVNFDLYASQRAKDIELAKGLHDTVGDVSGSFFLMGPVAEDRITPEFNADHHGEPYTSYCQVVDDIRFYSGYALPKSSCPNDDTPPEAAVPANWNKLKEVIKYQYFKGTVIPRLALYKDNIKYWQNWNEPDGNFNGSRFGIPAEALSLISTGKILKDKNGNSLNISFGETDTLVVDGKTYDLTNGFGGVVNDPSKKRRPEANLQ